MSHHKQRRMFRGRGGPNDSKLPKHNARRRKKTDPSTNDGEREVAATTKKEEACGGVGNVGDSQARKPEDQQDEDMIGSNCGQPMYHPLQPHAEEDQDDKEFQNEIAHLQKRIRNNCKHLSLSGDGLSDANAFQQNVLNAVANCFAEWKGILLHYARVISSNLEAPNTTRETGQMLFELLQQALQCGPLAGSKPGYFKRCGSEVATQVHTFLLQISSNPDEAQQLHLTEKQSSAIETWKTAALKAAEHHQPPSKSLLQRQQQATKAHQQKKQLQQKKKLKRVKKS